MQLNSETDLKPVENLCIKQLVREVKKSHRDATQLRFYRPVEVGNEHAALATELWCDVYTKGDNIEQTYVLMSGRDYTWFNRDEAMEIVSISKKTTQELLDFFNDL